MIDTKTLLPSMTPFRWVYESLLRYAASARTEGDKPNWLRMHPDVWLSVVASAPYAKAQMMISKGEDYDRLCGVPVVEDVDEEYLVIVTHSRERVFL